jgi:hypothetical protein
MKFPEPKRAPSGAKQFLKLGDGKSAIGVFRGEIEEFYQVYKDGKYERVRDEDPEGKFAFAINFVVKENNQHVAKIFQGNYYDYKMLKQLNEQFPLDSHVVQISQTGERQSKRISFLPMPKIPVNEAVLAQVELQP